MEWEFTTCISGRYKHFKKEVDLVREEFEDLGVRVLQPPYGPIVRMREDGFTPLKEELDWPMKLVEDKFLADMLESDFLYIVCPDGSIGNVVAMEIGAAIVKNIPMFSSRSTIDRNDEPHEVGWKSLIQVATVTEVITTMRKRRLESRTSLWLPGDRLELPDLSGFSKTRYIGE